MTSTKPHLIMLTDDWRNVIRILEIRNYDENVKPAIRTAATAFQKLSELDINVEFTDFIGNELLKAGYDIEFKQNLNELGHIIDVLDYETYTE